MALPIPVTSRTINRNTQIGPAVCIFVSSVKGIMTSTIIVTNMKFINHLMSTHETKTAINLFKMCDLNSTNTKIMSLHCLCHCAMSIFLMDTSAQQVFIIIVTTYPQVKWNILLYVINQTARVSEKSCHVKVLKSNIFNCWLKI